MPPVQDVLNRFLSRYQRALLAKTGVLAALSFGIAAALSWKLQTLQWPAWGSLGLPCAMALLALAGLLWWLRRRWIGRLMVAIHLDRALKLQERLITAEEFAGAATPPALYPVLVHETEEVLAAGKLPGLPRAIDRTAAALAIALLLLLIWPVSGQRAMQLARAPSAPLPEPPPPPPTPQGSTPDHQQRGASSQTPSSAQPPQGGTQGAEREPQQGPGGADQKSSGKPQEGSAESGDQRSQAGRTNEGQSGDQSQAEHQARRGSQHSGRTGEQEALRKEAERQMANAGRPSSGKTGSAEQGETAGQAGQATHQSSTDWQRQGGGGNLGNQEALKADIQQLLKELSGELEQLQAQLVAADTQAPQAGTHTDPELYGVPSVPEAQRATTVPIPLATDAEAVKAKRQGGGTGKASGEVSQAGPNAQDEAAQLAEQSLEVAPVNRQPVPPEYRGVFERLYERNTTTTNN